MAQKLILFGYCYSLTDEFPLNSKPLLILKIKTHLLKPLQFPAMKKTILKLSLMFLLTSLISSAFAQISNYERQPGYWTFGLNGGFAYQQSDIPATLEGYGLGFTLGKNLYYRPGSGLAFDLRGRGLYSKTYGLDYFQSFGIDNNDVFNGTNTLDYTKQGGGPGFVYQNNKTDHVELGLEGVVSFNKLREETNINLSLFGGVGLDWYNTKTDQADANGIYSPQYEGLNPTASVSHKKSQLRNAILDGIYETNAQGFEDSYGRLGIMPSAGFELGYQFTPKFSMGIGHKVTFTKTDQFDGQQWTDDNRLTGDKDIHHYTNLHMRWVINKKKEEQKPPVIKVIKPENDPFTSRSPNSFIRANIKNVKNAMDVKFSVNGYYEHFSFNGEKFSSNIRLQEGRNNITISASNLAGTDQENIVIFYEEPVIDYYEEDRRPTVDIINPPYDNFRTDDERFVVKATIRNIYDKRDIRFTVDGRDYHNYTFDSRTNNFTAAINLDEGRNEVRIEARNGIGRDAEEATIIFEKRFQQAPEVDITKPYDDPHYTSKRRVVLEAKVYNVDSKNDIRFTINGRRSSDFTFTNETLCANIDLYEYKTIVSIEGSNPVGTAGDDIVIFFEEENDEPEIEAPVVTINSMSQPTVDPFDPDNCNSTVIATVLNVESEHDITFILNGRKYYDFDFNPSNGVLKNTVSLEKGNNKVVIKAQNEAGADKDHASKEGCFNIENPPVVTITKPNKPSTTVSKPNAVISAKILNIDSKRDVEFFVNGKRTNNFTFDSRTKSFNANISLLAGKNKIRVKAANRDGADEKTVVLIFVKQAHRPPVVKFTRPSAPKSSTKSPDFSISASIKNVKKKGDIILTVNGKRQSEFSFKNTELKANLKLKKGQNTIVISATNQDGSDEDRRTVNYYAPVKLPEVTITRPGNNKSTDQPKTTVKATVKNVFNQRDVKLLVNGQSKSFTFFRDVLSAEIPLKEGKNKITVKAENSDGKDEATVYFIYKPPVPKPTVRIVSPKRPGVLSRKHKTTVEAIVENVKGKNDISIKLNGKLLRSFDFNPRTNKVTATITLTKGNNSLQIEGRNASGKASASSSIKYTKTETQSIKPPKVTITSVSEPTIDPFNPHKAKSTIIAKLENITSKEQISFTVNGRNNSNFTYSSKTQLFKSTVNLKKGKTTIKISVKNSAGNHEARRTITF